MRNGFGVRILKDPREPSGIGAPGTRMSHKMPSCILPGASSSRARCSKDSRGAASQPPFTRTGSPRPVEVAHRGGFRGTRRERRYVRLSVATHCARRQSSARNSRTLIPMARAVVSARLSLGPRSTPQAASQEASKTAGDSPDTVGLSTLAIAFSTRSIRDLSVLCMSASPPAGSSRQRSSAHPHLPFLDDQSVRRDELKVDDHGCGGGCQASFEPFHPPSESPRHRSVHDSASVKRRVRRLRRTSASERRLPQSSVGRPGGSSVNGTPSASHRRRILARNTSAGVLPASFRCIDVLSSSLRSRPTIVFNPAAPPRALLALWVGSGRLGLARVRGQHVLRLRSETTRGKRARVDSHRSPAPGNHADRASSSLDKAPPR